MSIIRHFCTVTKHRWLVFCHSIRAGIPVQGLLHDLSKFSPTEFFTSAKYYTGVGSPIVQERKDKGFSTVWLHHKSHNKHHIEYWHDVDQNGEYFPVKMPIRYVIEMFCDMLAANKVYKGENHADADAIAYFHRKNMSGRMHKDSAKLLESFFITLAEKGEKAAFQQIRQTKKQAKHDKTF